MPSRGFIMVATADWDAELWTNKQHSAVALAELGHRVLYVESLGLRPPRADVGDLKRILKRVVRMVAPPRRVRPGIFRLSPPVIPLQQYAAVRTVNRLLLTGMVHLWAALLLPAERVLWTYNPMTRALLHVPPGWRVIYHCVDRISEQPDMPKCQIRALERDLVQTADHVFVTSRDLEREWRSVRSDVRYLPNCVDEGHFRAARPVPAEWSWIDAPRIGLVGALAAYKVDYGLLAEIFTENPEWTLVLVGPDQDGSAELRSLRALDNVHWLGVRNYREVPAFMQHLDVGLIPAVRNSYTAAMFPMKFFEYLAAGTPVVATPIDALTEYGEVCEFGSDAVEFEKAIQALLDGDGPTAEDRAAVVADNTYLRRTTRMLALLDA